MTTRLEIEHVVEKRGKITRSRKTLFEVEDRKGVHETEFGPVQLDAKHERLCYKMDLPSLRKSGLYWLDIFYNRDFL